jgi:hypothetical protein
MCHGSRDPSRVGFLNVETLKQSDLPMCGLRTILRIAGVLTFAVPHV